MTVSSPSSPTSPVEDWSEQFGHPGQRVFIKRDDLLPFPLAGNKVRKLRAELAEHELAGRVIISVGAITSNHCRTIAYMAASSGTDVHLVMHGNQRRPSSRVALAQYDALSTKVTLAKPDDIRATIGQLKDKYGERALVIQGGCHTPAGVRAYMDAAVELATQLPIEPDVLLVATGTGATHAGLIAGCHRLGWKTRVVGISIARESQRAAAGVREALAWISDDFGQLPIAIDDRFNAGGYAMIDRTTEIAVRTGLRAGLPVDHTYMGKVMAAHFARSESNRPTETSVVIWHTGGLGNLIAYLTDATTK